MSTPPSSPGPQAGPSDTNGSRPSGGAGQPGRPGGPGRALGPVSRAGARLAAPVSRAGARLSERASQQLGYKDLREQRLAQSLAAFSIALGAAELLAPRALARFTGAGGPSILWRLLGAREIASGAGILADRQPSRWLWSRVGGDAMDVALLLLAMRGAAGRRLRIGAALAAVAGVAMLDMSASQRIGRHPRATLPEGAADGWLEFEHLVTINAPPAECYAAWRDFERLPRFMQHLESVRVLDDRRSHWVARAPAGKRVEWDAQITEDRPGELLAWRSMEGADVDNEGTVAFEAAPAGRGTIVRARMRYRPPGGVAGSWFALLFGEQPDVQAREDLRRFKRILEAGEAPTTEGQSAGPRSAIARLMHKVGP